MDEDVYNPPESMRVIVPLQRQVDFKVNKWMQKLGFVWHHEVNSGIELYWEKSGQRISQMQAVVLYLSIKKWWKFWL